MGNFLIVVFSVGGTFLSFSPAHAENIELYCPDADALSYQMTPYGSWVASGVIKGSKNRSINLATPYIPGKITHDLKKKPTSVYNRLAKMGKHNNIDVLECHYIDGSEKPQVNFYIISQPLSSLKGCEPLPEGGKGGFKCRE